MKSAREARRGSARRCRGIKQAEEHARCQQRRSKRHTMPTRRAAPAWSLREILVRMSIHGSPRKFNARHPVSLAGTKCAVYARTRTDIDKGSIRPALATILCGPPWLLSQAKPGDLAHPLLLGMNAAGMDRTFA